MARQKAIKVTLTMTIPAGDGSVAQFQAAAQRLGTIKSAVAAHTEPGDGATWTDKLVTLADNPVT